MENHILLSTALQPFQTIQLSTTPRGNVQSHSHNDSTDKTSTWESQDPAEENLAELLPVDTSQIHVDQRNTDHGTSNALSS